MQVIIIIIKQFVQGEWNLIVSVQFSTKLLSTWSKPHN